MSAWSCLILFQCNYCFISVCLQNCTLSLHSGTILPPLILPVWCQILTQSRTITLPSPCPKSISVCFHQPVSIGKTYIPEPSKHTKGCWLTTWNWVHIQRCLYNCPGWLDVGKLITSASQLLLSTQPHPMWKSQEVREKRFLVLAVQTHGGAGGSLPGLSVRMRRRNCGHGDPSSYSFHLHYVFMKLCVLVETSTPETGSLCSFFNQLKVTK